MKPINTALFMILLAAAPGWSQDFPAAALEPLEEAIKVRRSAQEARDEWDEERIKLAAQFQALTEESKALRDEEADLEEARSRAAESTASLKDQMKQMSLMASDLEPVLAAAVDRLRENAASGPPYEAARKGVVAESLDQVMQDPAASPGEKLRRVFQALLDEAQRSGAAEAAQEMIRVEGREFMAEVLKLGDVSHFFLTLDRTRSGWWDEASRSWRAGPPQFNRAVSTAMDVASKRRPAEVAVLPIGKLALP